MNLTTELERALEAPGGEPPHRDLDGLLADAHRSLRRRRLAVGGAIAALAVVVGVSAAAAMDAGPDPSRSIASDASPDTAGLVGEPGPPYAEYAPSPGGQLVFDEEVAGVLETIENPLGFAEPDMSAAVRLTLADGGERWELIAWDPAGESSFTVTAEPGSVEQKTFRFWVKVQQLIYGTEKELVVFKGPDADPPLVPRLGASIVDIQTDVDINGMWTPEGWTTYVASVVDPAGARHFAIVRVSNTTGEVQYLTAPASRSGATTIDEFLTYVRGLAPNELP
jgi:hypothetical protein